MKRSQHAFAKAVVVLLGALAATLLLAQGPHGPGGPGGPPPGAPLAALLLDAKTHAALALSSEQELLWTRLQAAEAALRAQAESGHAAMGTLISTQFSSGAPDLVAIETAALAQHQAMEDAVKAVAADAIALYTNLDTGQQAIVVTAALTRYQNAPKRPAAPVAGTL